MISNSKIRRLKEQLAALEDKLDEVTTKHHAEQNKIRKHFDKKAHELEEEVGKHIELIYGFKVGDVFYTKGHYDARRNKVSVIKATITNFDVDVSLYMDGKGDVFVQSMRPSGYNMRERITEIFKTPEEAAEDLFTRLTNLVCVATNKPLDAINVENFDKKERDS